MAGKGSGKRKGSKAEKRSARKGGLALGGTGATVVKRTERYDFSYTQNRELSWLRFDDRVLDEALDESVPLFERLKFVSIFCSNLDEFFMIRVGGLSDLAELKRQPVENKSNLTPLEQIERISEALPALMRRAEGAFSSLETELKGYGIERLRPDRLFGDDLTFVERYFHAYLSPIISPLVIDPRHPFPNLRNGALYLVCTLDAPDEGGLMGLVEVPASAPRAIEVPAKRAGGRAYRYILVEDILRTCIGSCFGALAPKDCAVIRVTRNADIDPDGEGVEEESDYRQHMKRILKKRLRLQPVRLQVSGELKKRTEAYVRRELGLRKPSVTHTQMPLDLGYVFGIEGRVPEVVRDEVLFRPFKPQPSPMFDMRRPLRGQVEEGDKLLFYPYESMDPLLGLVAQAARDPQCISIRITLYRVAKQSRLCESLIAASEAGKDVTVLMELRARFDEENNIEWAGRLDEAGCTVIYGSEGFKCHSKICQVTYRNGLDVSRITLLGTGNFNEKTARLYSDFMLMTADKGIGEDANAFFRNLSLGNLHGSYRYLGVAPAGLKPLIMTGLNREIERARAGRAAHVFFKLNSLTDREVIDKISEASRAGVRVDMIVRGISCLVPGVPGKTDNVHVRSIVGRFLEHARVYAFGEEDDTVYLSSADMMTRNTEHRVEIAFPVLDETCRELVRSYMRMQLADNVKARELGQDGCWHRIERAGNEKPFNSQQHLLMLAYRNAQEAEERARDIAPTPAANAPAAEKPPRRVRATVIEPHGDASAPSLHAGSTAPAHALARAPHGHVRTGLALIGLGLKTLLVGSKSAGEGNDAARTVRAPKGRQTSRRRGAGGSRRNGKRP